MRFSLTALLSLLFLAYVGNAIWTIASLFYPATCSRTGPQCLEAHLESHSSLQLLLYTSNTEHIRRHTQLKLLDRWSDVTLDDVITKQYSEPLAVSAEDIRRGHCYLHAFLCSSSSSSGSGTSGGSGSSQCASAPWHSATATHTVTRLLQLHVPTPQVFNLLQSPHQPESANTGDKPATASDITRDASHRPLAAQSGSTEKVPHVHSQISLLVLADTRRLARDQMSADLVALLGLTTTSKRQSYLPVLRRDGLSSLSTHLVPVAAAAANSSMPVNFTLSLNPVSIGKLRLFVQFELSMVSMKSLGFTDKDLDDVKGLFRDTNMVLLLITMFVTAVHLLFDFLAFKNDIDFWRRRRSLAGISCRTVVWRAFSQLLILLYLIDQRTSYLVITPMAVGTVIEFWKVCRAWRVQLVWPHRHTTTTASSSWWWQWRRWLALPRVTIATASADELKTNQMDSQSMRYLSYLLYPLCVAGAVYSLLYTPHKSWYSWCIQSTVNGVYAFGFLFMLPQLFLNYQLKSVAHLPWRALMYKAFNTFIDDLFAFIIVMPTAHRVACFRDDAIFLVYLVQRWLYPVDKLRLDSADSFASCAETTAAAAAVDKKQQ